MRMIHSPIFQCRPSAICHGIFFAAGIGNAAVLSTTRRLTWSWCDSAQPKPIMPPQSCTARVTGPVMPRCFSSASRSSTRDCSVYS
ncbi:hypothetical protein D3C72_1534830 [compost metagenome]